MVVGVVGVAAAALGPHPKSTAAWSTISVAMAKEAVQAGLGALRTCNVVPWKAFPRKGGSFIHTMHACQIV